MDKKALITRIAFSLALFIPVYFLIAALGTKFGLWDWKFGLGTLLFQGAPILLGITALLGLIALGMTLFKKPRTGWAKPLFALLLPAGVFAYLGSVGSVAGENPIHDVATDTANPPAFSAATMTARGDGSNPLSDYAMPLGQTEFWNDKVAEPLASQSQAQIVGELYPDLGPILVNAGDEAKAIAAAKAAMEELGFSNVTTGEASVEGVAETFWFGFKDDVAVRVADGRVDFRSVSRVGQSDLGANAKRIAELRAKVEAKLAE